MMTQVEEGICMQLFLKAICSFLFLFSTAYAEDPCQEAFRLACQDVTVNLDEGSRIQTLSELAQLGRQLIPEIKQEMITVLRQRVVDETLLRGIIVRIQNIEVVIAENTEAMSYNHELNRVNVGMLFFKEFNPPYRVHPSIFSFIQAVSHEIAHAFDPCILQLPVGEQAAQQTPALLNLNGLTSQQAIAAYPISSLQCLADPNISVGMGYGPVNDENVNPSHPKYGKPLCQVLRLNETMSDYLAAEVLNLFIQKKFSYLTHQLLIHGVANIYSIHCHAKSPPENGSSVVHPNAATRLAWIVLKQPGIRDRLQCGSSQDMKKYCQ